ncbi:restriction endonuclease [Cronobacter turicensis]|uniref:restriction endonuclease n=1 Tax=Cronobacter dublinensis TaxID=413497 RepID=UPI0023DD509B|nr:restriction endonuclease [Cronobacter dublinensis]ELQ6023003.1 restriction endonuclease [Cronobacter turicensis]ELQ6077854.1 restriction endonuclease [Cronobacter turicensis]ELQ6184846.1 restriction endonuclease [Cronobacter turicensis]ELQ6235538.1 restriction endonuclease [Cronobacter turicensis]ELQ6239790.1 restriction endonuclease [Cronobacter turicensis]
MKLKIQDLRLFNLVFESQPGYILDFSNSTLSTFFNEELNIDIDDERYREEGTSKARRVRCLLKKVDRETALRVLNALWQHKTGSMPEQAEQSRNDWLALVSRLENTDAVTARGDKPVPVWHGVDWPSLVAEMNAMKALAPHPRGFRFESWLAELFSTFNLAPRASFRNTGEQIDGSFRLNNEIYLMEAKWHQNRTPAADLHVFEGKLSTKATWTRGVFISWMGFTPEGLTAFGKGKRVICVSGYDLYHSLSHGIALPDLLEAKVRHAAETGEPYAQFDRLYTFKDKIPGTLK